MPESEDFLQYLQHHEKERKALYGKLWPEIEAAAKKAGFPVKRSDLDALAKEYCNSSASGMPKGSTWSP